MQFRKVLSTIPFLVILFSLFLNPVAYPVQGAKSTGYDLVNAVNAYRVSMGKEELRINAQLMAAAQAQADWLSANYPIGSGADGHVGAGGSRPIDRAYAYGYGNGATVIVSENWAHDSQLTAEELVYSSYWADAAHQNTMLSGYGTEYLDIGAGVASNDRSTFFVVDVGRVSGDEGGDTSGGQTYINPLVTEAPINVYQVRVTSTPNEDGSVVHTIQEGETLTSIAEAYGVSTAQIKALNNMQDEWEPIYAGHHLIIKPAGSETQIPSTTPTLGEPTATETPIPTYTPRVRPTRTPTPDEAKGTPYDSQATVTPDPLKASHTVGLVVSIVCGFGLIVFLGFLFKK